KAHILTLGLLLSLMDAWADVKIGSSITGLSAFNQENTHVKLDEFTKKGLVLVYFFPKADTPGCTKQACSLRDAYPKLQNENVKIFGVSTDSPKELKAFQKKHRIPFDFISDNKKTWARAFEVPVTLGFASRQAFLLKAGKVVWMDRSASTSEQAQDVLAV